MQPKIILPVNLKNKIQFIVDNCSMEVSGLGTVVFDKKENAYRITDVILLEQEVGSAHTDLDDKAVAKACYDMRDAEGELAFWWHSHVNMDTFWSGTDHSTMDSIGKNGLCVAIVFNKKEEMRGAIVMSADNYPTVKVDNVSIEVEYEYDFNTEELLKEIKDKVKPKVYTPPKHDHTLYNYHNYHNKAVDTHKKGNTLLSEERTTDRDIELLKNLYPPKFVEEMLVEWKQLDGRTKFQYYDFMDYVEQRDGDMAFEQKWARDDRN
jgi:proteasome lid subunit RPN8/RPN11